MTETLLLNTKPAIRAAVEALDTNTEVRMCLGIDGDCDFSCSASDFVPYRCTKVELLELVDAQPDGAIPTIPGLPQYLVLSRRHVAYRPDILQCGPGDARRGA